MRGKTNILSTNSNSENLEILGDIKEYEIYSNTIIKKGEFISLFQTYDFTQLISDGAAFNSTAKIAKVNDTDFVFSYINSNLNISMLYIRIINDLPLVVWAQEIPFRTVHVDSGYTYEFIYKNGKGLLFGCSSATSGGYAYLHYMSLNITDFGISYNDSKKMTFAGTSSAIPNTNKERAIKAKFINDNYIFLSYYRGGCKICKLLSNGDLEEGDVFSELNTSTLNCYFINTISDSRIIIVCGNMDECRCYLLELNLSEKSLSYIDKQKFDDNYTNDKFIFIDNKIIRVQKNRSNYYVIEGKNIIDNTLTLIPKLILGSIDYIYFNLFDLNKNKLLVKVYNGEEIIIQIGDTFKILNKNETEESYYPNFSITNEKGFFYSSINDYQNKIYNTSISVYNIIENEVKPYVGKTYIIKNNGFIKGIAKTEGVSGETASIYIPN